MEKIIIYTVNIGGYDKGHSIDLPHECLYFTDQKTAPKGWKHMLIKTGGRKESRKLKINSHLLPPHDISIYIDANLKTEKDITKLLKYLKTDIAIPRHTRDMCVYQHARRCIALKLDNPVIIKKHIDKLRRNGMPRHYGLTENCFIIRRNNDRIKELNQLWWRTYKGGSQRDQLSLPYALWKTNTEVSYLPINYSDPHHRINEWWSGWGKHLKSMDSSWLKQL